MRPRRIRKIKRVIQEKREYENTNSIVGDSDSVVPMNKSDDDEFEPDVSQKLKKMKKKILKDLPDGS